MKTRTLSVEKSVNLASYDDALVAPIKFLINSGADVTMIGGHDWELLKRKFENGSVHKYSFHNGVCGTVGSFQFSQGTDESWTIFQSRNFNPVFP